MALRRPRAKKTDKVETPVEATPTETTVEDAPNEPTEETPTEKPAPPVSSPNHDEEW